jgi:hypothetical protein
MTSRTNRLLAFLNSLHLDDVTRQQAYSAAYKLRLASAREVLTRVPGCSPADLTVLDAKLASGKPIAQKQLRLDMYELLPSVVPTLF